MSAERSLQARTAKQLLRSLMTELNQLVRDPEAAPARVRAAAEAVANQSRRYEEATHAD